MKVTVLGSGTSSGIPVIGCPCNVCNSTNPKNTRLRSSCWFQVDGKSIIVDTGPDFRQQALTHKIGRVDAVLYTHTHADHVHGIDDLRIYNAYQKSSIPAYGNQPTLDYLQATFGYIFNPVTPYPSLVPKLEPRLAEGLFDCAGVKVQAVPCKHGEKYQTLNYRIGNVAWLTDTSGIPDSSVELLKGLEFLFVDGLRLAPHPTHFNLEASLQAAEVIGARKTYLIHLAHDYNHDDFNRTLPDNVELAYDGLTVEVNG